MLFKKRNPSLGKGMYKGYVDTCIEDKTEADNSLEFKTRVDQLRDYAKHLHEKKLPRKEKISKIKEKIIDTNAIQEEECVQGSSIDKKIDSLAGKIYYQSLFDAPLSYHTLNNKYHN